MSSVIGNKIKLSVFGESHGEAIGCVIDGLPNGIKLDFDEINREMARRAPGNDKTATPRKESDTPIILSGVLNDTTTGAPLAMEIKNTNTRSGDYGNLMTVPRPSHSDYPAYVKYNGNNDVRGGGHFSGRLTAPIVFAGAVAKQILKAKGITIGAHISKIGSACDTPFDKNNISEAELEAVTH
ncbi:MAG: chorismate synthase, partial [Eubacterium sp.]|nr:chorismate synthase [Eubacterium sp.]